MQANYRHYGCRITDDLIYKGMRTLFLENELVRVGILLDKGADIFQWLYKPSDTDFLWRSPNGLHRPDRFTASRAASGGSFLDRYEGGWQVILPGGGPVVYHGAELGLHGEVSLLGWDCDILQDTPEAISVRLSVECVRTPFRVVRTLRLESNNPALFIDETVTNLSPEPQDFMWGHHPALGAPFLRDGLRLFVPAGRACPQIPRFMSTSLLEPGAEFDWPLARVGQGTRDLSRIPGPEAGFAELVYLKDLSAGWYAVLDPDRKLGIGLAWPKEVFPYLWFWQVYGKAPGYPWYDRVYVIALEPWTSIPDHLDQAIAAGRQAHLEGGASLHANLTATVITGLEEVHQVEPDGSFR